jgi:hypothetical protein
MWAAFLRLLPWLEGIAATLTAFYLLFTPRGRSQMTWLIINLIGGALDAAVPLIEGVAGGLRSVEQAFVVAFRDHGGGIADDLKGPIAAFARSGFDVVSGSLAKKGLATPDKWRENAGDAMADAFGFGLASFGVTAAFEAAFPEKLNTLNGLGPMLATLAGFSEVTSAALRPLFYAAIAQPARYDSNSKFRSLLPDLMHAGVMYSRRQIDEATYGTLLAAAGLSPDYVAAMAAISYRPIQPRALATAIQDTAFPTDTMREILEDNALNPGHVQFFLDVLERNSTKGIRNSYISEALSAYAQGVVSDSEFDDILTSVEWSDTAKQLARSRALLQRRVTLATEVEAQMTALVASGGVTAEVGEQQLEAAGVQPWLATLKITLAETRASISALKRAASEEHKLEITRQRNNSRTAIAEYQAGTIDAVGLTAALALVGLDPTLIASIVAVQSALRAGRMRLVYGQLLSPADATLLVDRVGAIESQLKKQLIDIDHARAQLAGLNVDEKQAGALLAKWAALIAGATKTGELLSPATGRP